MTNYDMFKEIAEYISSSKYITQEEISSTYLGSIACSLASIADDLHEAVKREMKDDAPVPSKIDQDELPETTDIDIQFDSKWTIIIFDNREQAEDIITTMLLDNIYKYGFVTVEELKHSLEINVKESDRYFGWYDINPYTISNYGISSTILKLPPVTYIKENKK